MLFILFFFFSFSPLCTLISLNWTRWAGVINRVILKTLAVIPSKYHQNAILVLSKDFVKLCNLLWNLFLTMFQLAGYSQDRSHRVVSAFPFFLTLGPSELAYREQSSWGNRKWKHFWKANTQIRTWKGREALDWRRLRTEASHHFHKGWSRKSPVIFNHSKQIQYFKICKTSLLAYDIMSKTQNCIWPGCSPNHLSEWWCLCSFTYFSNKTFN